MVKNDVIEMNGRVLEVLPDSKFRVELDGGHTILGYLSGRMIKNHIQVMMGDRVIVELTPYDLSRGRVTRRLNPEKIQRQ